MFAISSRIEVLFFRSANIKDVCAKFYLFPEQHAAPCKNSVVSSAFFSDVLSAPPVPAATTESSIIALSWSQENTNVNLCARNDHHLGLVRRRCPALISRLSSPAAQPLPLSSTVFHQPPRPISYLLALPFSRCSLGQHLSLAELWREALCCRCLRDRVINIIISLLVLYEFFFLSLHRINSLSRSSPPYPS